MQRDLHELRSIALLKELTPATLRCVAEVVVPLHYDAGELITLEGDPCTAVYFILSGSVRVYRVSPEGREQVLVTVHAGQAFNTVPPFTPERRNPANADAQGEVELVSIALDDVHHLVQTCPDFARVLLTDFAQRLQHLTAMVEILGLYSVQERLARFLLEQAANEAGDVQRSWTQEEIAAHLGTVREMVGRSLRGFAKKDLIAFSRGRITIVDRDGLEAQAGGGG